MELYLIFQCMIAIVCMRTESVSSTQVKHLHPGLAIQDLSQHHNHTECPMWFNYSSATNVCQCFPFWLLIQKCDSKFAFADLGQILTYNSNKGLISTTTIQCGYLSGYIMTKTRYILFLNSISTCVDH